MPTKFHFPEFSAIVRPSKFVKGSYSAFSDSGKWLGRGSTKKIAIEIARATDPRIAKVFQVFCGRTGKLICYRKDYCSFWNFSK